MEIPNRGHTLAVPEYRSNPFSCKMKREADVASKLRLMPNRIGLSAVRHCYKVTKSRSAQPGTVKVLYID